MKKVQDTFEGQINDTKTKINGKAQALIKDLSCENRNNPFTDCTDNRLTEFQDKEYVKSKCMDFYGEAGLEKCSLQRNFCKQCCSHFVGLNFMDIRNSCIDSCNQITNVKSKWRDSSIDQNGIVNPNPPRSEQNPDGQQQLVDGQQQLVAAPGMTASMQ